MASLKVNGPTLTRTALQALARGWSVIPLNRDKLPHWALLETGHHQQSNGKDVPSWKVFQQERPTVDEVKYWFTGNREQMLAVVCGAISGVVVLDFDGPSGRKLLHDLKLQPHVRTGSGGFHVYFRHPGYHISTLAGKNKSDLPAHLRNLDVRADGGTAVLPPSCSRKGPYQLLRPFEDLEDLRTLPDEVLDWFNLRAPAATPKAIQPPQKPLMPSFQGSSNARRVGTTRLLWDAVNRAASGRNNAAFWLSCQLRDNDYTQEQAREVLEQFVDNVSHLNGEAFTLQEALSSMSSAYRGRKRQAWHAR